jgi:hypothetical protein
MEDGRWKVEKTRKLSPLCANNIDDDDICWKKVY